MKYWMPSICRQVSRMITAAMAWCDGYVAPLLVPLNGWLQPPLPLQIRTLACPQGVRLVEAAPSGQHVVVVPPHGDAQLWHVMSGQLVHTFRGACFVIFINFIIFTTFHNLLLELNRSLESNIVRGSNSTVAVLADRFRRYVDNSLGHEGTNAET